MKQTTETKKEQQATVSRKNMIKKVLFGTGLVAIVVLLVVLVKWGTGRTDNVSPDPVIGSENAPVVITEYSDFQCPACASSFPAIEDLIEEYGDKVQYVYNDFPLPIPEHKYATDAAIAAECAFQQGKFFELTRILFEKQAEWSTKNSREAMQEQITTYAKNQALDMDAFESCVSSQQAADKINEDAAEAQKLRLNSTPTFFVEGNGIKKKITDPPFSQNIREAIDEILSQ